jgi:hypothetical protein
MQGDNKDVGYIEDSAMILQNQVACENHAHMSYMATKNKKYIEMADIVRKDRSKLLYELIPENKGQNYCIAKHISAIIMGYKELANRKMEFNKIEEAKELLETANNYELLFRLLTTKEGLK